MLVPLACVLALSCGGSPTAPDGPQPPGRGGGGGGGGTGPTGETAIASDDTFDDSDWDNVVQVSGAGGTGSGSHLHYLGQASGDYRHITIAVNSAQGSAAQVAVFSIMRGTSYSPSSDGAIYSVDYAEDSIRFSGGGDGQYSAPAFRQNGKLYTLVPGGGAFPTPDLAWTRHSLTGLRQENFRTLASASDHPNFSAGGGRIEVGFMRLVSVPAGSAGGEWKGGIDNWRITLNR